MVPCHGRGRRAKQWYLFPEDGYLPAGADRFQVVQPYWSAKLKKFPTRQGLAVVLVDTHGSISYSNTKPDMVGYLANKPQSVHHITLVGNVKAQHEAN